MNARGIYRELDHSPGRVDDDRAIMRCVGEALTSRGFDVELVDADTAFDTRCANIFVMCERVAVLDRLADAQNAGCVVVNSPNAIRNTYRHRMVELFAKYLISAPVSRIVASSANKSRPAAAVWIKRMISTRRSLPMSFMWHRTRDGTRLWTGSPGAASLSLSPRSMWWATWSNFTV